MTDQVVEIEMVEIVMPVPKETAELCEGLAKFVEAIKIAVADGWQPSQDLPVVLTAAMAYLPKAIEGFEKLDEEAKRHPSNVIGATGFLASKLYEAFTSSKT